MADDGRSGRADGGLIYQDAPAIRPKGLIEATSEIQQVSAIERRGGIVAGDYYTDQNNLMFYEVGIKTALVSGMVGLICAPLCIGVARGVLPAFGDPVPTLFDQVYTFALAATMPLGYAILIGKTCRGRSGAFSGKMTRDLALGAVVMSFAMSLFEFLAFHWLYLRLTPALAAEWLGHFSGWMSDSILGWVYYLLVAFRPILLESAYLMVGISFIFILIIVLARVIPPRRHRMWKQG